MRIGRAPDDERAFGRGLTAVGRGRLKGDRRRRHGARGERCHAGEADEKEERESRTPSRELA
jgi:hypothetical protein